MNTALLLGALLVAQPATAAKDAIILKPVPSQAAQPAPPAEKPQHRDWYFEWGYNTEQYASPDIRFRQTDLGNDFTLENVYLRDSKAWDIWNHPISVPQYSWRIGKFIRENTAIEFNFDHAKALLDPGQNLTMTGTLNGVPVNQQVAVDNVVQVYKLNNGANFALVNLVQRYTLWGTPGKTGHISILAKAGLGFMLPHTENTVLGQPNEPGFQFGGIGAGIEGAVRAHVYKTIFVAVAQKGFYGHYRNLHIAGGRADQDLWAYVTVISFGTTFHF
jgi:hypothetical protein